MHVVPFVYAPNLRERELAEARPGLGELVVSTRPTKATAITLFGIDVADEGPDSPVTYAVASRYVSLSVTAGRVVFKWVPVFVTEWAVTKETSMPWVLHEGDETHGRAPGTVLPLADYRSHHVTTMSASDDEVPFKIDVLAVGKAGAKPVYIGTAFMTLGEVKAAPGASLERRLKLAPGNVLETKARGLARRGVVRVSATGLGHFALIAPEQRTHARPAKAPTSASDVAELRKLLDKAARHALVVRG